MKKMMGNLLSLIFIGCNLQADIIETNSVKDLVSHVEEGTLVVFDIDNTLLECNQMFGSHEWFCYQMQALKERGLDSHQALAKVLPLYTDIQPHTSFRLVEAEVVEIIRSLQRAGYPVMALTSRDELVSEATKRHLYAHGIDMRLTAPLKESAVLEHEGETTHYQEGVLFTGNAQGGAHKGKALWALLEKTPNLPRKIVFINDTFSHLLPVEEVAAQKKIAFIGLRYGVTDIKVQQFRQEIADIQKEFYKKILTDEAAEAILRDRQAKGKM
ncbi:DUF2608 domain-containing protein [Candidatus Protochlamydia phocaeensis]|uniref:DUF2608 domain-containing protein n=1 Tax=Candidatus Protochlamydia phocaeensis TaxID=1414722 RepID=UPI0008393F9C|nr:DUF2608 domain-containing protein [Candidatus Protochlamydia phocaeensis]